MEYRSAFVMDSHPQADAAATVIVLQRAREDTLDEFASWQGRIGMAVSRCEGFLGSEVVPPTSDGQHDWAVIYHFDHNEHLKAWLDSPQRKALLAEGRHLFVGEPQVFLNQDGGHGHGGAGSVSMIVSHRVRPGQEAAYEQWQDRIVEVQQSFPGYIGTEFFPPIDGIQDNWTAVIRFENAADLDAWSSSSERSAILQDAGGIFDDMTVRRVASGFGAWFSMGDNARHSAGVPALWKQTLAVLVALYPLTLILSLWVTHPLDVSFATGLLIGDTISVVLLSYLVMPWTNRILAFWMNPTASRRLSTAIAGIGLIAAFTAVMWALFTYLVPHSGTGLS